MKSVTSIIFGSILAVAASTVSAVPEVLERVDVFSSPTEQPDSGIEGSLDLAFQDDELGLSLDAYTAKPKVGYIWNRGATSYKPWISVERTSIDEVDTDEIEIGLETTYYGDNRSVVLGTSWEKEEVQDSYTVELTHNSDLMTGWTFGQHVGYEDTGDEGTETTLRTGAIWSISDDFHALGSIGAILTDSDTTTKDIILAIEHDLGSTATVGVGGRWAKADSGGMSENIQAWEVRVDFFKQGNVTPYVNFISESVDGVEEQVTYVGLKIKF